MITLRESTALPKKFVCKKASYATGYRDGGSLGFGYVAENGKEYELVLKVVLDSPEDCKRYYEPLVFRKDVNSGNVVFHPTWAQSVEFLSLVSFENPVLSEMKNIVGIGGWSLRNAT